MSYVSEAPREAAIGGVRHSAWLFFYQNVSAITAVLDCLLIVASSIAAGVGYHLATTGGAGDVQSYVGIGANSALLFVLFAKSQGMYRAPSLRLSRYARSVIVAWSSVFLSVIVLLFLLKLGESYSRGAMLGFGALGLVALIGSRALIAKILRDAVARESSIPGPTAILIGDAGELASHPKSELLRAYGVIEVGRFELPQGDVGDPVVLADSVARLNLAVDAARVSQADRVLAALKWSDTTRYDLVREALRALPLPVMLLPDRAARAILSQPMVEVGSEVAVELQRTPLTATERLLKRVFDVVAASGLLLLLSPLLLLVSVAIKLETRGPVIFRQHRKGFNGRPFTIYKFRTMTVCENGTSIRQAQANDSRATPLGAFLRSTSIDELPQLINVLRGEMSLVGPRPHAVAHDDEYAKVIARYAYRHHVKPGITGLAQVKGLRGETAKLELMERRVDQDLWYINNWSMWLDLWILFRTCIVVPRRLNAH
jgi:undecaprenyl-phosphate galactose phosphotransferase/putative colanic acid biosynthesis UDP-glucose lipid carrier transferase